MCTIHSTIHGGFFILTSVSPEWTRENVQGKTTNFSCLKWSIYFAVAAKVRGTVPSVLQHWPGFPAHRGRHWAETAMEHCQGIYGWSKSWGNVGDSSLSQRKCTFSLREVQGHCEDHQSCPRTSVPAPLLRCLELDSLQEWQQRWPLSEEIRSPFRLWEGNCCSPLSLAWNTIPNREGWARMGAGLGSASLGWFVLEGAGKSRAASREGILPEQWGRKMICEEGWQSVRRFGICQGQREISDSLARRLIKIKMSTL